MMCPLYMWLSQRGPRRDDIININKLFPKKENLGSHHQHLFKENIEKTKKIRNGLRFEETRIQESFTYGEGVNTPHARHEDDNL